MDASNRLEEMRAAVGRLEPYQHACTLYGGRDEEATMAAAFVRAGLDRGDRCVCILDDGRDIIRGALASEGIDVDAEVQAGRLILFERRLDSKLKTLDMAAKIEQWADEARKAGYPGCSITGEMTWSLDGDRTEIAIFESGLNRKRFWEAHRCTGLCQFDVTRFTHETLREMILVHPIVIVGGRMCRNPYYVPPERYLSPDWPRRETDWMVNNLEQLETAQDELRLSEESYRALVRRLVVLQEDERRDISRELHDQVGQSLAALRINLELIRTRASDAEDEQTRVRAEDSIELIESTFKSVQNVMYGLRPPLLEEAGLAAPLQWYSQQFTARTGIPVEIHGVKDCRCGAEAEAALFRIVQEALTNVARHSQAKHVRIELKDDDGATVLIVEDDGIGFDKSRDRSGKAGYGLVTMRERAEGVGGVFEKTSEEGGGTRITVRVPRKN